MKRAAIKFKSGEIYAGRRHIYIHTMPMATGPSSSVPDTYTLICKKGLSLNMIISGFSTGYTESSISMMRSPKLELNDTKNDVSSPFDVYPISGNIISNSHENWKRWNVNLIFFKKYDIPPIAVSDFAKINCDGKRLIVTVKVDDSDDTYVTYAIESNGRTSK